MVRRLMPALLTFALTIAVLVPPALTKPQFWDEQFYAWAGSYLWQHLTHLDFDPRPGPDPRTDPGWNPHDWWFVSSPQGFRLLYAAVMQVGQLAPPSRAYIWADRDQPQPAADVPPETLRVLRLFSVACTAFGLAALAIRFGWAGTVATLPLIVIARAFGAPYHAMAEGPLLLGLGLCVLAYGSRWFGLAAGFAASCKLTALGAWPLILLPHAAGSGRMARWIGLASALGFWVAINPAAWFDGGPLYLVTQITFRASEQSQLSAPAGLYLPSWYLIPFVYGLAVVYAAGLAAFLRRSRVARALGNRLAHRLDRAIPPTEIPHHIT